MGEKGLELGLPPTASTSARQNPLLGSEQDHITPCLSLACSLAQTAWWETQ